METMTKLRLAAAVAAAAISASAAQFQPTTGGNLDDPTNWNNVTDSSYAVVRQQSAPLTVSTASATMPNNGNLIYRTNVHTNDFGAGHVLTIPFLTIEQGATLAHRSGSIDVTSTSVSSKIDAGSATVEGAGSAWNFALLSFPADKGGSLTVRDGASLAVSGSMTVDAGAEIVIDDALAETASCTINAGSAAVTGSGGVWRAETTTLATGGGLEVSDGATFAVTGAMTVQAGAEVSVENATFSHDTMADNKIVVNAGGTIRLKNSTLSFSGSKGKLCVAGGTAVFDGATISFGNANTAHFGGSTRVAGGTIRFEGAPSSINHRFLMYGDGLEFCVSNTTVSFAPAAADELFITSIGTVADGNAKTFRFCGAAPRLAVASSDGFHLRAEKGVLLRFELGADFDPVAPVVEITGGGTFKGDKDCLSASQVVVDVDDGCPPGTYTLLKGKAATTFLTGESKWVANCGNKRSTKFQTAGTAGTADESLQIVVTDTAAATVICFR